jgi:hypothetical protein
MWQPHLGAGSPANRIDQRHLTEDSEKAICVNRSLKYGAERNAGTHYSYCLQIGRANISMIKPLLHFGQMVGDRERTASRNFNAPHRESPLLSSACVSIIVE